MARGGSNNGGNCNASGNGNNDGNGNQFSGLDSKDRSHLDDSNSPFHLSNGDYPCLYMISNHM